MKYTDALDLNEKVYRIIDVLGMNHINKSRVHCIRSSGSSTRCVIARCHTLSKVLQHSMRIEPFYVIEALSERFDKMPEEDQMKTLLHELMHIPKTFGGGFRHHDFVTRRNVETLYRKFFGK